MYPYKAYESELISFLIRLFSTLPQFQIKSWEQIEKNNANLEFRTYLIELSRYIQESLHYWILFVFAIQVLHLAYLAFYVSLGSLHVLIRDSASTLYDSRIVCREDWVLKLRLLLRVAWLFSVQHYIPKAMVGLDTLLTNGLSSDSCFVSFEITNNVIIVG